MQLKQFQILNFRSINDSGKIEASRITSLLGRNESGKSNLLRGLHSLNPPSGFIALNPIKDFPRHRKLSECSDETPVVVSTWSLDEIDQRALEDIWPRAQSIEEVSVGRNYGKNTRYVGISVPDHEFDHSKISTKARKIAAGVKAKVSDLENAQKQITFTAAETFQNEIEKFQDAEKWANSAKDTLSNLRIELAKVDVELSDAQEQYILDLEQLANQISDDEESHTKARAFIIEKLPIFMFLEDYPEINGHQDIAQFLSRRSTADKTLADTNFEKLCKVAGLDPEELHSLSSSGDQETRSQLANRAGSVITTAIRDRWNDRPLKVRFNLDANHFDTLISDPNSTYDVEVNLDERSRGFQWFFAFYVVFTADTDGGEAKNAILLLDEPGLYLHAKSQNDLLKHLETDFSNQIIFTTHSPFMVPTHHLDWVRTVNISEDSGTTVSNDPTGDAKTLFPLQAALGYDLAQSLFVGPHNLIVEGVTDFWIMSAVSDFLNDNSGTGLNPDLTITPAGGAQKVHYMVALLTSEHLNVIVLFDDEKEAKSTRDDLVKGRLIKGDNIVFVTSAFSSDPPKEADIEDVFTPALYEDLVKESYKEELKGKKLNLNPKVPRIAKRFEMAFDELEISFHKTRPARFFLKKIAEDGPRILDDETLERFKKLFAKINNTFDKQIRRDTKPF